MHNGYKTEVGPRKNHGGYAKWNWCSMCTSVWDKTYKRCPDCNQAIRVKSRYK